MPRPQGSSALSHPAGTQPADLLTNVKDLPADEVQGQIPGSGVDGIGERKASLHVEAPALFCGNENTSWTSLSWIDFSQLPDKGRTVVIVPIVGFADWNLHLPLDVEETLLSNILREASARSRCAFPVLTIPPLRFVAGPQDVCAFTVSPPVICALVEETALSIKAGGFQKIVLLNSSPWNEELCDAVARDLRIDHGLQMFCINMSALDIDLHPRRGPMRKTIQGLFETLTGIERDPMAHALGSSEEHDNGVGLLGEDVRSLFDSAVDRLSSLLREIYERPPLGNSINAGKAEAK